MGKTIPKVLHRVRVAASDAHYGGGLVDGAYVLKLFGDVATEVLIRSDGVEGLFRAYESIEFLAPVYGGDFLEVEGDLVKKGNSSRQIRFEARKVIAARPDPDRPDRAEVLEPPQLVCRALGTCVVLKKQPGDS